MVWKADAPHGNEAAKIKYLIVPFTRGVGLDVGCGDYKAYAHMTGVDDVKHAASWGITVKPDVNANALDLPFRDGSQDFVFSSHCLEHIADFRAALREWWRVIKPGGHLVLYLPHKLFYPNIGTSDANPDHKHDFMPRDIEEAMMEVGVTTGWDFLLNEDRNGGIEHSFVQVFRKRDDGTFNHQWLSEKPKKSICIVRYGGFGDMLQTAAVFPELKRQGYHITMMCSPEGQAVIRHDPHVDDWIVQDKGQVPNEELGPYWHEWELRFTKMVNYSESVEVTWLAVPGRTNHRWPDSVRRKYMDANYAEFMADLAEVPFRPEGRFYPAEGEILNAGAFLTELRRANAKRLGVKPMQRTPPTFNVLWTLGGSSVHKFYPRQDEVIARMMLEMPEAQVVFSGDDFCRLLEAGWENEPRVIRKSGEMSIRDTLTLAMLSDCVVGPETGVLNAVAYEPVRKVVFLSHSSENNLTKHWVNTHACVPDVPCHPCHRMHYTRQWCPEDEETGAAVCAKSIPADVVFAAIKVAYDQWRAHNRIKEAA